MARFLSEDPISLTVTITREPDGSVAARGGDSVALLLLDHAGFSYADDPSGFRRHLDASVAREEQTAISSHAARMLRAARYAVRLDPALDNDAGVPHRAPSLGDQVLALTDRIRGTETAAALAGAVLPLLHPFDGVLQRVREALEAVGERITDLDGEAYALADRYAFAAEFVSAAQSELVGIGEGTHRVDPRQERAATRDRPARDAPDTVRAAHSHPHREPAARNGACPAPAAAPPADPARNPTPRAR